MSLLWRDQLRIVLSPDSVFLLRLGKGLRPKVVTRQLVPCSPSATDAAPWTAALHALQDKLPALGGRRMEATVVLSNHFVRYALVPWSDQLNSDSEEQAYVRHCFSRTYGDDAEAWAVRMSANGAGGSQVVSAIDQALLDGLERISAASGLRLVSVQPHLMAAFNYWRHRLAGPTVWFVLAERGRLCLSLLKHGRWISLHTMKTGDGWPAELPRLLERELCLVDDGGKRGTVFLSAPEQVDESVFTGSGWAVRRLKTEAGRGIPPDGDLQFAMEMRG